MYIFYVVFFSQIFFTLVRSVRVKRPKEFKGSLSILKCSAPSFSQKVSFNHFTFFLPCKLFFLMSIFRRLAENHLLFSALIYMIYAKCVPNKYATNVQTNMLHLNIFKYMSFCIFYVILGVKNAGNNIFSKSSFTWLAVSVKV